MGRREPRQPACRGRSDVSHQRATEFERTNEYGISHREVERLVDDVDRWLSELPRNGAKKITVQITAELKREAVPDA